MYNGITVAGDVNSYSVFPGDVTVTVFFSPNVSVESTVICIYTDETVNLVSSAFKNTDFFKC